MAQNIKYRLLDEEFFPKFVAEFKAFVLETEKHEIEPRFAEHFLMTTIANMKNPQYLFLLATIGKKVAGFRLLVPAQGINGIPAAAANGIYVTKEHRNKGIALKMLDVSKAWAKGKGYKEIYMWQPYENGKWMKRKHFGFSPYKILMKMEV